jgi:hypothetical protein
MTVQLPIPVRADPQALHTANIKSFVRALIAFGVTEHARGDAKMMERALRERFEDDRLAPLILKAAVTPLTIATADGLPQVDLIDDLLVLVGKVSAAAQVLQAGLVLRFGTDAQISVPLLESDPTKVNFVGEGQPIPVQAFTASLLASVTPHKMAAILVLTSEMLAGSNAEALMTELLRRSVGLSLDNCLFDSVAASSVRPAGLRNGIAALTAAATGPPAIERMLADLAMLAAAVAPIGPAIFVASAERAAKLKLLSYSPPPYRIFGSPGVAQTDLIAIAENGVAAVLGQPTFDSTRTAALHLETAPTDITGGTPSPAVPVKSMFQTDSVAIKVNLDTSWTRRDNRAVAWCSPTW